MSLLNKTPKWSISKKRFINCDEGYAAAQADIIHLLIAMGNNVDAIKQWCEDNNADFEVVK